MSWTPGDVSQVVAAAAMWAVAAWLLATKATSPRNRALALFFVVRGATVMMQRVPAAIDPDLLLVTQAMSRYLVLLQPFLLAWFMLVLVRRETLGWQVGLVGGAIFVQAAYLIDHCLETCGTSYGPLFVVSQSTSLALAAAGLVAAAAAHHAGRGEHAASLWLLAAALSLNGLLDGLIGWFDLAIGDNPLSGRGAWFLAAYLVYASSGLVAFGTVAWLTAQARGQLQRPAWIAALWTGGAVVALTALLIVAGWARIGTGVVLAGILRAMMPALAAYGLVRHRFLNRARPAYPTIQRGAVGSAFVAVFFAVSEAAAVLSSTWLKSTYWGIGAAAVLVFFLAPLQDLGERVGRRLTEAPPLDPARIYEEQLTIVWQDGVQGAKERLLLDRLRQRLGISADDAAAMEHAVATQRA